MWHRTDVIIPARNEESTIGAVVKAWLECGNVGQVIVVDNNSSDHTYQAAYQAGAFMVREAEVGKGQAVAAGLNYVTADRVALCDADLHGFTEDHAYLLTQAFAGEIIGYLEFPGNIPKPKAFAGFVAISGQRCLPTNLLRSVPLFGYDIETAINDAVSKAGMPIQIVKLDGAYPSFKVGPLRIVDVIRDRLRRRVTA
jgi:glycosyltransferase involved in cell wall biosynthesis